jgi:hypothetical protein
VRRVIFALAPDVEVRHEAREISVATHEGVIEIGYLEPTLTGIADRICSIAAGRGTGMKFSVG